MPRWRRSGGAPGAGWVLGPDREAPPSARRSCARPAAAGPIAEEPRLTVGMAEHRRQTAEVFLPTLFTGRDRTAHALQIGRTANTVGVAAGWESACWRS